MRRISSQMNELSSFVKRTVIFRTYDISMTRSRQDVVALPDTHAG